MPKHGDDLDVVHKAPSSIHGVQQEDHEPSERVGDDRDRNAEDRDQRAEAHDRESDTRDERSEARDRRAEARDEAAIRFDPPTASDRVAAFRDRQGAASDRMQAADDRKAAARDRLISARDRAVSSIDELTGAYRRDAGTLELERETLRAQRTQRPLVLAFVDVDGLKSTNDTLGHAAGDQLLRRTVDRIRTQVRSYDLVVRFGGDEFVCLLLDLDTSEAAKRFEAIKVDLEETEHGSITVGLTELRLEEEDSLEHLMARADEALYSKRVHRPPV
jgi:diguanylate cyclase (GGDEF)-like protein